MKNLAMLPRNLTRLCFLNFWMPLVSVSYFSHYLNYVSYEVFLINCTACSTRYNEDWGYSPPTARRRWWRRQHLHQTRPKDLENKQNRKHHGTHYHSRSLAAVLMPSSAGRALGTPICFSSGPTNFLPFGCPNHLIITMNMFFAPKSPPKRAFESSMPIFLGLSVPNFFHADDKSYERSQFIALKT